MNGLKENFIAIVVALLNFWLRLMATVFTHMA